MILHGYLGSTTLADEMKKSSRGPEFLQALGGRKLNYEAERSITGTTLINNKENQNSDCDNIYA